MNDQSKQWKPRLDFSSGNCLIGVYISIAVPPFYLGTYLVVIKTFEHALYDNYLRLLFFVLERLSAFRSCCCAQVYFRLESVMEANGLDPVGLLPREESDLGPYRVQCGPL